MLLRTSRIVLFLFLPLFARGQVAIRQAKDFRITDIGGRTHHLFDYLDAGRYVVLYFFFPECTPCGKTAPSIEKAFRQMGCNQADVVFIGLTRTGDAAASALFAKTYGVSFPIAAKEGGAAAAVTGYGVKEFPTICLIAPDRQILERDIYPVTTKKLVKILRGRGIAEAACPAPRPPVTRRRVNVKILTKTVYNDFEYEVSTVSPVNIRIRVLDILGREVAEPVNRKIDKNVHEKISFVRFLPGLYLVQFIAGGQIVRTERISKIAP